jgi:hypothetical protein
MDKTVKEILDKEDEFNSKKYFKECEPADKKSLFIKNKGEKE